MADKPKTEKHVHTVNNDALKKEVNELKAKANAKPAAQPPAPPAK